MTLSSQEKPLFQKKFLDDTYFFYSVRAFAPIRQHYFSKYWGTNAWVPPPPQIFWGGRPASPPRSSPLVTGACKAILQHNNVLRYGILLYGDSIKVSQTVCIIYLMPDHITLKLSRYLENSTNTMIPTHRNISLNR